MYCKNLPKNKLKILKQAEKKGLFDDFMCPKEHPNKINFRNEKIKNDGIWYYCNTCGWLDVIGWDIIEDSINNN